MEIENTQRVATREEASAWIVGYIVAALDMDKQDFSPDVRFDSYGLDSAELVIMAGIMEEQVGLEIDPEVFFETPTVTGVLDSLVANGVLRA